MQGMILAAGMGKRLKALTQNNTKCMVKVCGVTLIERMLRQLDGLNLSKIVIVVGYEGQKLIDFIRTLNVRTPIVFVDNPIYYKTNNIYSLSLAKDYLVQEDTLLLESDLIFEDSVLKALVEDPRDTLALVDKYEAWMDGTCITIGEDDFIASFTPGKKLNFGDVSGYYKTVNLYKFSREFSRSHYVPFLSAYTMALGDNEYYEQVLRVIAMLDDPVIKAKKLTGQRWYEIDDIQDLDIAESMFAPDEYECLERIQGRYGGYWRYPKLTDFCYLVNPYYPTQRMMDEMNASFEELLTQYPSGMRVNSLLAARNFGVDQKHILVGNGAAELIKALMENLTGKVGFIRPTFEEYPNRWTKDSVVYVPENEDFAYTADDLMAYFENQEIQTLVVINPDNPTGNYIPKANVLKLAAWCMEKGITLVLDESFVDFADEENCSLIDDEILERYPNLFVMKSISKSFGVPGARLGVLATANEQVIGDMKKQVAIWNINSFGEYYMQIEEKYRKDYVAALAKTRIARARFLEGLRAIPGLRVIPTQANYVTVELLDGLDSRKLCKDLLRSYDLFIKDLTPKMKRPGKQYVRLAIRNIQDNEKLLAALREVLN